LKFNLLLSGLSVHVVAEHAFAAQSTLLSVSIADTVALFTAFIAVTTVLYCFGRNLSDKRVLTVAALTKIFIATHALFVANAVVIFAIGRLAFAGDYSGFLESLVQVVIDRV
jgi:hypothetical protein